MIHFVRLTLARLRFAFGYPEQLECAHRAVPLLPPHFETSLPAWTEVQGWTFISDEIHVPTKPSNWRTVVLEVPVEHPDGRSGPITFFAIKKEN